MIDINYDDIEEPENFHIITSYDGLVINNSKEDMDALFEQLENVKYDPKLAEFIFNFKRNEIRDLTIIKKKEKLIES